MNLVTSIFKQLDNTLDNYVSPIFIFLVLLLHGLYALTFFNIIENKKAFIEKVNVAIQLFICAVLIIRFNPIRSADFKEYDRKIIFASAMFLLANLGISQNIEAYFENIASNVAKKIIL
jgi:hypothetical protein